MMFYSQDNFDVRFDWGLDGLQNIAADCNAVIIVDVLSFATSLDIAVSRGATIIRPGPVTPPHWQQPNRPFSPAVTASPPLPRLPPRPIPCRPLLCSLFPPLPD